MIITFKEEYLIDEYLIDLYEGHAIFADSPKYAIRFADRITAEEALKEVRRAGWYEATIKEWRSD